jgi:UrcA family protein
MDTPLKAIVGSTFVALTLLAASVGNAQGSPKLPEAPVPSAHVNSSDLDLSKAEDLEVLYSRIRRAARNVCTKEHFNWWNHARALHVNRCVETAVGQAVDAVRNSQLATLYQSKTASASLSAAPDSRAE